MRPAFLDVFVASLAVAVAATGVGCRHDGSSGRGEGAVTAPQGADCGHAACGSNFFVDTAQPSGCTQGANCTATLTLVAMGDYHVNDDYPYKFRADDLAHVTFQGTDPAGPNVFSKTASNWRKTTPQAGVMSVTFQSADKGTKNISGVFKLSVCSAQNCQLEQASLTVPVVVR